jgi:hypothetical protein
VPQTGAITVDLDIVRPPKAARDRADDRRPGGAEDMRMFGGFSIASLAPGDYRMRAIVSLDGRRSESRPTLRKSQ